MVQYTDSTIFGAAANNNRSSSCCKSTSGAPGVDGSGSRPLAETWGRAVCVMLMCATETYSSHRGCRPFL
jgi:hypothetical protein